MDSKNSLLVFLFFFFFVSISNATEWPCSLTNFVGKKFDLSAQNGNTSNFNQPYLLTDENGKFTYSFYLCDPITNPFSTGDSICTGNTLICMKDNYNSERPDFYLGNGPPKISQSGIGLLLEPSSYGEFWVTDSCGYYETDQYGHSHPISFSDMSGSITVLCPYTAGKKNNDYEIVVKGHKTRRRSSCPLIHEITLYIDSACIGPICCTYQSEKNSFNVFSLCAENTCPLLSGYSLTHTSNLNGGDCSICEPYFDDAKCCLYANQNHGSNEKVTCELSGICPPKDSSRTLVGEFPTTSVKYCQVIQEFPASSSGKIESISQPQGSQTDSSDPSSSDSSSLYYFFAFVVFFLVGMVLVLSYLLYFKQKSFQLQERQEGVDMMMTEMEVNSE